MRAVPAARTPVPVFVAKVIPNIIIYILYADGAATACYGELTQTILPICSDQNLMKNWPQMIAHGSSSNSLVFRLPVPSES